MEIKLQFIEEMSNRVRRGDLRSPVQGNVTNYSKLDAKTKCFTMRATAGRPYDIVDKLIIKLKFDCGNLLKNKGIYDNMVCTGIIS